MNPTPVNGIPSTRSVRHKHLRITSWVTVIVAAIGFPIALVLYSIATVSCMGGLGGIGWCEIFSASPWLGLGLAIAAYLFVMWIIHELGRESLRDKAGAAPASRYAWQHAALGYKELEQGHHHLVRRVHRVSAVAMAGLAAYVSFRYFEADTLTNIAVAIIAYIVGEQIELEKLSHADAG